MEELPHQFRVCPQVLKASSLRYVQKTRKIPLSVVTALLGPRLWGHCHVAVPLASQIQGLHNPNSDPPGLSQSETYTPESCTRPSHVLLTSTTNSAPICPRHCIPTSDPGPPPLPAPHTHRRPPCPPNRSPCARTQLHCPSRLPASGVSERADRVLSWFVSRPRPVCPHPHDARPPRRARPTCSAHVGAKGRGGPLRGSCVTVPTPTLQSRKGLV